CIRILLIVEANPIPFIVIAEFGQPLENSQRILRIRYSGPGIPAKERGHIATGGYFPINPVCFVMYFLDAGKTTFQSWTITFSRITIRSDRFSLFESTTYMIFFQKGYEVFCPGKHKNIFVRRFAVLRYFSVCFALDRWQTQ